MKRILVLGIALLFGCIAFAQTPVETAVPGSEKVLSSKVIAIGGQPVVEEKAPEGEVAEDATESATSKKALKTWSDKRGRRYYYYTSVPVPPTEAAEAVTEEAPIEDTTTEEPAEDAEDVAEPEQLNEEFKEVVTTKRVARRVCGPTGCQIVWEDVPVKTRVKAGPVAKIKEKREVKAALAEEFELAVIAKVNEYRMQAGLNPLAPDEEQCVGARQHSQYMASRGGLVHAGGYMECIAMINGQADAVVNLWMNSPPHRSIIMSQGRSRIAVGHFGQWHTLRVW